MRIMVDYGSSGIGWHVVSLLLIFFFWVSLLPHSTVGALSLFCVHACVCVLLYVRARNFLFGQHVSLVGCYYASTWNDQMKPFIILHSQSSDEKQTEQESEVLWRECVSEEIQGERVRERERERERNRDRE